MCISANTIFACLHKPRNSMKMMSVQIHLHILYTTDAVDTAPE